MRKYDILLIADEVITAFGRIGYAFGCELYNIRPDLMTIAKGLTSAYLPLSAVIVGDSVWDALVQGCEKFGPFGHGLTYSGHARSAAAGLANLDILESENIIQNAKATGEHFQERLHATFDDHPLVGEVRGVSLLAALEFVGDKKQKERFKPDLKVGPRIATACLEQGLIARAMPQGDILGFARPLIVTWSDVDEIVDRTKRAVDQVTEELVREGVVNTE